MTFTQKIKNQSKTCLVWLFLEKHTEKLWTNYRGLVFTVCDISHSAKIKKLQGK